MGIFDFVAKVQEKINDIQKKIETISLESLIVKPKAPSIVQMPKQSRTAKQIIKRLYADYPEPPYISNDRKADWIDRAELFPKQCIIPKSMMERNADGLLPGHIYMLYWLKKYTNKSIPAYFEYKYGINFEKEKAFLLQNEYLDEKNKPTEKGKQIINQYFDVIQNHTMPKPDRTIAGISAQIFAQRDNLKNEGFKEYVFIANRKCCEICAKLNGNHFLLEELKTGVNAPPMHDGCCCAIAAYKNEGIDAIDDDDEYEQWLDFISKGGTTKQWEKRKNNKRW